MREVEARWFEERLRDRPPETLSPCLNIGSGAVRPPFANTLLFEPLAARGVDVVNVDLKQGGVVDVVGDIFDPSVQARLRDLKPGLIICSNMVEHIPAPLLTRLPEVLHGLFGGRDGLLIVSAPCSFPYHADPIDTYYRPTVQDLEALFAPFTLIEGATIPSDTFAADMRKFSGADARRYITRLLKPFRKRERWKTAAHKLFWLTRRYTHTVTLFRSMPGCEARPENPTDANRTVQAAARGQP